MSALTDIEEKLSTLTPAEKAQALRWLVQDMGECFPGIEAPKEVGYKDTAYFCRRFKMMFGIPAGKMRRRESAMNI